MKKLLLAFSLTLCLAAAASADGIIHTGNDKTGPTPTPTPAAAQSLEPQGEQEPSELGALLAAAGEGLLAVWHVIA